MIFDDWFNEVEVFSLRSERFYDGVDKFINDLILSWIKAAYEAGYEHAKLELLDDGK